MGVQEILFELTLIVTCTMPGFGVIEPDSSTEPPKVVDCGETVKEIDVI